MSSISRSVRNRSRTRWRPAFAHAGAEVRVAQELHETCRRTPSTELTRKPVTPSLDLEPDAADIPADDRVLLPHRLRDVEAEALAERLLQDERGLALEGVDLQVADPCRFDRT